MNTSTYLALSRQTALQSTQSASGGREVRLRTSCVVEYTVQSAAGRKRDDSLDAGTLRDDEIVLLSVYVPHCMLNPDQVRIVEV